MDVNAGVGSATPSGTAVFYQLKMTIDVNLTAAMATCEGAIGLFRVQDCGRCSLAASCWKAGAGFNSVCQDRAD